MFSSKPKKNASSEFLIFARSASNLAATAPTRESFQKMPKCKLLGPFFRKFVFRIRLNERFLTVFNPSNWMA